MKNLFLIFIASWLLNAAVFVSLAQAQEVVAPTSLVILECWCKCGNFKTYRGDSCKAKSDCYATCVKACGSRGLADYDCVTQNPIITKPTDPGLVEEQEAAEPGTSERTSPH